MFDEQLVASAGSHRSAARTAPVHMKDLSTTRLGMIAHHDICRHGIGNIAVPRLFHNKSDPSRRSG